MYSRFFDHAVNTGLAKAGAIGDYSAHLATDLDAAVNGHKDLFNKMVDKAAKGSELTRR